MPDNISVPISRPSFNWECTNLYKAFNKFKLQVNNLLVEGPFSKLGQKQKIAMLLNLMGGKVYNIFANDLIFADPEHKEKLNEVIKAFNVYFKPTCGMIHTWYQMGSLYSNNCKFQSNIMSKLCELSKSCNFTNPE